jgi:hypothetical protein
VEFRHVLTVLGLGVSCLAFTSPANATWRVAESTHFTVYSEGDAAELQSQVVKLEKFDRLMRNFAGTSKPSSPVKLTLYHLRNMQAVAAALPYPTQGIGGFYNTSERGPFLVATRKGDDDGMRSARKSVDQFAKDWGWGTIQHEYVHHFMYQYFPGNYPSWYSEGFAEYYGSMEFSQDGVIEVGHAPVYRMDTMRQAAWLPVKKLLTARSYDDVGEDIGSLYAEGWLLTHMAAQNPARGKQLKDYLAKVASGSDYLTAATAAFGDLDALDRELRDHAKHLQALRYPIKAIDVGPITVRELGPLESALLGTDMRIDTGYAKADLPLVIRTTRSALAAKPDDVHGLEILARLQELQGDRAGTDETVEHLLRVAPGNATALLVKGRMASAQLGAAKSTDKAAWGSARADLARAIKAAPNRPEPLAAAFRSYLDQGVLPPDDAQNGLMKALELMPQNEELRYLVASDFEKRGLIDDAIYIIGPAAFASLGGDEGKEAKREREMARIGRKYTRFESHESAATMYKRLVAAKGQKLQKDGKAAT